MQQIWLIFSNNLACTLASSFGPHENQIQNIHERKNGGQAFNPWLFFLLPVQRFAMIDKRFKWFILCGTSWTSYCMRSSKRCLSGSKRETTWGLIYLWFMFCLCLLRLPPKVAYFMKTCWNYLLHSWMGLERASC